MKEISFNEKEMKKLCKEVASENDNILLNIKSIKEEMNKLSICWSGDTEKEYIEGFNKTVMIAELYQKELESFISDLRYAITQYDNNNHLIKECLMLLYDL